MSAAAGRSPRWGMAEATAGAELRAVWATADPTQRSQCAASRSGGNRGRVRALKVAGCREPTRESAMDGAGRAPSLLEIPSPGGSQSPLSGAKRGREKELYWPVYYGAHPPGRWRLAMSG